MPKSKIPYLLFGLVGLFMLLDIGFVYLAQTTYTGVYTENHYKKGLNFNQIYKSEIYQDKTGWQSEIILQGNQFIFILLDNKGQPIRGAKVVAKAIRPVTDRFDQNIELQEENGRYIGFITLPLKGQWELRVKAQKDHHEYVTSKRIGARK